MKNHSLRYFLFLVLLFCGSIAQQAPAANRPISEKWDVRNGTDRRMPVRWFAGESVAFDLQPVNGRTAIDLTGATVIWEVTDWTGLTNAYLSATGTVSGATASWLLTPDQTNLPEGTYNGYARAITGSDERLVLAWQTVKVLWSPASDNYALVQPQPLNYTKAEIDAMFGQYNGSNSAELAATSNTLAGATALKQDADAAATDAELLSTSNTLAQATALKQDAATAATDADLSAGLALKQDAATAATDAELLSTSNTLAGATALKQEADTAATDAELLATSNSLAQATALKQDADTAATDAELSAGLALKQDADTAATDTELTATSNTLAQATALKLDAAETNAFATAAQGELADGAVQVDDNGFAEESDVVRQFLGYEPPPEISVTIDSGGYSECNGSYALMPDKFNGRPKWSNGLTGSDTIWILNTGQAWQLYKPTGAVTMYAIESVSLVPPETGWSNYEFDPSPPPGSMPYLYWIPTMTVDIPYVAQSGGTATGLTALAESLTLDHEITSWADIGVTYSDAVRINSPILVTNDSAWTGWTTTGTLSDGTIRLNVGEYLESPTQSNGIARVDWTEWSHMGATLYFTAVYTNGVSYGRPPYRAAGGKWRIYADFLMPMATEGLYISNATITAYADVTEAATEKIVAYLGIIDDPVDDRDAASKRYVDAGDATSRAWSDSSLSAYAANPDKTVRGSELRLGNMWVVSPADASGDRFIVSGGEISGDGELVGTTTEFVVSKNGYPLLSFQSDASGLYITNHTISATSSNVTVNLSVATNGVTSAPYAEWTENLVVGEWTRVLTYDTETYPTVSNDTYTLEFTVAATNTGFFRAMQDEGDSVMTVKADELNLGAAHLVFNSVSNTTTYAATLWWDATNKVFIVTEEAL